MFGWLSCIRWEWRHQVQKDAKVKTGECEKADNDVRYYAVWAYPTDRATDSDPGDIPSQFSGPGPQSWVGSSEAAGPLSKGPQVKFGKPPGDVLGEARRGELRSAR